jgi:hypothetical protein
MFLCVYKSDFFICFSFETQTKKNLNLFRINAKTSSFFVAKKANYNDTNEYRSSQYVYVLYACCHYIYFNCSMQSESDEESQKKKYCVYTYIYVCLLLVFCIVICILQYKSSYLYYYILALFFKYIFYSFLFWLAIIIAK